MSNKAKSAFEAYKKRKEEENGEKSSPSSSVNKAASAFEAYKKRKQSESKGAVSTLAKKINDEIEKAKTISSPSWGKGTLRTSLDTVRDSTLNVNNLIQEVESYKSYFDEKTYNSLLSPLQQLKSGYDSHISSANVMDNFSSQKEYDAFVSYKKTEDEANSYDSKALKEKLDKIAEANKIQSDYDGQIKKAEETIEQSYNRLLQGGYTGNQLTELKNRIEAQGQAEIDRLKKERDEKLSAYGDISEIAYATLDGKNVTWQSLYDNKVFEENNAKQIADAKAAENYADIVAQANSMTGSISDWGLADVGENKVAALRGFVGNFISAQAMAGTVRSAYYEDQTLAVEMTQDEADLYGYYLLTVGKEKADAYFDELKPELEKRKIETTKELWTDVATEAPVFSSILSVGSSLASGAEYIGDLFTGDQYNTSATVTSTIRGTVSDMVDWEIGNWDAFDFLYNTGMSAADSVVAGAVFGQAGGVVLGLSAAAQGTNDALERGLSKDQAFWSGLSAGVFEGLFETVSIGQFSALKESFAFGGKEIAKNIAKSMLVNASEETLTEVANIVYDTIANGDFSNYETTIRMYMEQGMTEAEAKHQASVDLGLQVVEAGASGALMGFGFGGIGSAVQNHNYNNPYHFDSKTAKSIYGNGSDLVAEGIDIGGKAGSLAEKYQGKLDKGKSLSGRQINRLVNANETTMRNNDIASIKSAVAQRLTELGETGDIDAISTAIATAIARKALGDKTTPEANTIKNSKYGQRVANELNPKNIISGQYSSAWAEQLNTDRINPEEYNKELYDLAKKKSGVTEEATEKPANPLPKTGKSLDKAMFTETVSNSYDATQEATESDFEPTETVAEEENTVKLSDAATKYGAQAQVMIHSYLDGQDVAKYDAAYKAAYDMGKSGIPLSYVMNSESTSYLAERQKKLAYEAGKTAADTTAKEQDAKNKQAANGKTGRRKGVVKGEGVKLADLRKSLNDTQNTAYKVLATTAEATGIDIVLYQSESDADGNFIGSQGKFKWSEDTIYIDVNAGLANIKDVNDLAKYAMLRTFSHEFTHFIEKWNPIWYNEFRKAVFETLTERGENVHDLIEEKQAATPDMTYDEASREVVAEAMTDILPDSSFVESLATKHKNVFEKLLDKLKGLLLSQRCPPTARRQTRRDPLQSYPLSFHSKNSVFRGARTQVIS